MAQIVSIIRVLARPDMLATAFEDDYARELGRRLWRAARAIEVNSPAS